MDTVVQSTQPVGTDPSLVWRQLSQHLDAFVAAWSRGPTPPSLADFLPAEPLALRRITLVELIKVDLEHRWQPGRETKLIEDYLADFPELASDGVLPCDVLYEEYHIRKQRGESVSPGDYCARFPAQADELRRLLPLESSEMTTTLVSVQLAEVIKPGEKVDDFEVLAELGHGAFASVYLARQTSLQRLVALKVSLDRGCEPQTMAQMDHPNIVHVFDQRQLPERRQRLLYMQYVSGGTLQAVIQQARQAIPAARSGATLLGAVDRALVARGESAPTASLVRRQFHRATWPQTVCWIGARLAAALAYAHSRGVLHRDVKPANVLLSAEGSPLLADFNISCSKLSGASGAAYFGGSLAYMSPEQLEACDPAHSREPDDLDGRSDVYSLGVMLWEMLIARRPFDDDAVPHNWSHGLSAMTAVRRGGVPAAARDLLPPNCPAGLVDVLLKCLAPNRDDRFATADDVARELDLCLQPRAQALMHGRNWSAPLRRWPTTIALVATLGPNVVMCLLNIAYNWVEIVQHLSGAAQHVFFKFQIGTVNTASYMGGLSWFFVVAGGALRTVSRLAAGDMDASAPDPALARRWLRLGDLVAGITASLWTVSGLIFPFWMQIGAGAHSGMTSGHYVHFFISQLLCGMIAASQTFYAVTFCAVRFGYPWLVQGRLASPADTPELAALARRSRLYFGLAVSVPFLAVMLSVFIDTGREAIGALGLVGLIAFAAAYWLDTQIRGDLAALAGIVNPGGDSLGGDHSSDSFLTGSRR